MDKIVFYKERDFGEKFNVTFEFVKQNWKILLRYALYGILPLAFVGALSLNSLMQNMVDVSSGNSMFSDELSYSMLFSYALLLPTSLAAYIWIGTVVFSMMQFYNAHDEGLQGVTFQELKPSFRRNAWRLFKCGLVGSLIGIVFLAIFSMYMMNKAFSQRNVVSALRVNLLRMPVRMFLTLVKMRLLSGVRKQEYHKATELRMKWWSSSMAMSMMMKTPIII